MLSQKTLKIKKLEEIIRAPVVVVKNIKSVVWGRWKNRERVRFLFVMRNLYAGL